MREFFSFVGRYFSSLEFERHTGRSSSRASAHGAGWLHPLGLYGDN